MLGFESVTKPEQINILNGIVKLIDALEARRKDKRKHDLIVINENVNNSIIFQDLVYICEAFGYEYVSSRLVDENVMAVLVSENDYLRQPPNLYKNLEEKTLIKGE